MRLEFATNWADDGRWWLQMSRPGKCVGGELIVRWNREFEKVLGRDASSDNFLKKQLC